MNTIGMSEVERTVDPSYGKAIAAYLANGGTIERCPPSRHGECKPRKGIQFGNGNAKKQPEVRQQSLRDLMIDPTIHCVQGKFVSIK